MSGEKNKLQPAPLKLTRKFGRSHSSSSLKDSPFYKKICFFESQQHSPGSDNRLQVESFALSQRSTSRKEQGEVCDQTQLAQHRTVNRTKWAPMADTEGCVPKPSSIKLPITRTSSDYFRNGLSCLNSRENLHDHWEKFQPHCNHPEGFSSRASPENSHQLQIPRSRVGRSRRSSQEAIQHINDKCQNTPRYPSPDESSQLRYMQLPSTSLTHSVPNHNPPPNQTSNIQSQISRTTPSFSLTDGTDCISDSSSRCYNELPFSTHPSTAVEPDALSCSPCTDALQRSVSPSNYTDYPSDASLISRSTSPGGLSDAASREDLDVTAFIPSHECASEPGNRNSRLAGSDNESLKSTATINLTPRNSSQMSKQKVSCVRKIHIIKSSTSLPDFLQNEAPIHRLDEWLSSVMKIKEQTPQDSNWAFPDYDVKSPTQEKAAGVFCLPVPFSPIHSNARDDKLVSSNNNSKSGVEILQSVPISQNIHIETDLPISSPSLAKSVPSDSCRLCSSNSSSFHQSLDHLTEDKRRSGLYHNQRRPCREPSINGLPNQQTQCKQIPPLTHSFQCLQKVHEQEENSQCLPSSSITICVTEDTAVTEQLSHVKTNCPRDFCQRHQQQTLFPTDGRQRSHRHSHDRVSHVSTAHSQPYNSATNVRPSFDDSRQQISHRLPLSPRSSVGSVTSIHSTRSSNADSAVDLCPPDDDQDIDPELEMSFHHSPKTCRCHVYSDIPREGRNKTLYSEKSPTLSTLAQNMKFDISACEMLTEMALEKNKNAPNISPCVHQSRNCQHDVGKFALIGSSETSLETQITSHSTLSTIMPNENSSVFSETSKQTYSDKVSDRGSRNVSPPVSLILPHAVSPASVQNYEDASNKEFRPNLSLKIDNTLSESHTDREAMPNQESQWRHARKESAPRSIPPRIPHLVISDHSEHLPSGLVGKHDWANRDVPTSSRDKSQSSPSLAYLTSAPVSCFNIPSLSSSPEPRESPLPTNGTGVDLLDVNFKMNRSPSVSSMTSEGSTCSTCTLYSDSDTDSAAPRRKQSSWRKIRSFILWSPFIQVFKKHRYPWIQLAGHQGNFQAGDAGSVLKKLDSREQLCFQKLMSDSLKDFVPEYRGDVEKNGDTYIQLQDLLCSFTQPSVMDIKMGVRTYLEEELHKARKSPTLRKDMYQKMMEVDSNAPTEEEHQQKAVTKPRYMQWRDEMSSSVQLGFRVEGIKKGDGNSSKDFKKTKSRKSVVEVIRSFVGENQNIVTKYIRRLRDVMHTQESSPFFQSHEVIGSSLLFVHDIDGNVSIWMIDFGKTEPLPESVSIDHRKAWQEGNHEDGYLFGLDNLLSVLEEIESGFSSSSV